MKKLQPKGLSEEAVTKATGKGWDAWFKLLDKAGMKTKPHKEIAQWLWDQKLIESGWWCQGVTVEYERHHGRRQIHQTSGGFSVSVSRTVIGSLSKLFAQMQKQPVKFSTINRNKGLRGKWADGSNVIFAFYPKPGGKVQVVVQHEKLADNKAVTAMRRHWQTVLAGLA